MKLKELPYEDFIFGATLGWILADLFSLWKALIYAILLSVSIKLIVER